MIEQEERPDYQEKQRLFSGRRPDVLHVLLPGSSHNLYALPRQPPKIPCFFADVIERKGKPQSRTVATSSKTSSRSILEAAKQARQLLQQPYVPAKRRIQTKRNIATGAEQPVPAYDDVEDSLEDCSESIAQSLAFEYTATSIIEDRTSRKSYTVRCSCVDEFCDPSTCDCIRRSAQGLFEPSSRRIVRKPDYHREVIYLCSPECGCKGGCNNTSKKAPARFECVRRHRVIGYGLRTLSSLVQGELVLEFAGHVIEDDTLAEQDNNSIVYSLWLSGRNYIDCYGKGNHARFISHSRGPNLTIVRVAYYGLPVNKEQVWLVAAESILAGSELTIDYGDEYVREHLAGGCLCDLPLCSSCKPAICEMTESEFEQVFLLREAMTRCRIIEHEKEMAAAAASNAYVDEDTEQREISEASVRIGEAEENDCVILDDEVRAESNSPFEADVHDGKENEGIRLPGELSAEAPGNVANEDEDGHDEYLIEEFEGESVETGKTCPSAGEKTQLLSIAVADSDQEDCVILENEENEAEVREKSETKNEDDDIILLETPRMSPARPWQSKVLTSRVAEEQKTSPFVQPRTFSVPLFSSVSRGGTLAQQNPWAALQERRGDDSSIVRQIFGGEPGGNASSRSFGLRSNIQETAAVKPAANFSKPRVCEPHAKSDDDENEGRSPPMKRRSCDERLPRYRNNDGRWYASSP